MTPEQHRRRALQLEEFVATRGDQPNRSGISVSELARQHRNVARMIGRRQRTVSREPFHRTRPRNLTNDLILRPSDAGAYYMAASTRGAGRET
jgi:hypothetical protein